MWQCGSGEKGDVWQCGSVAVWRLFPKTYTCVRAGEFIETTATLPHCHTFGLRHSYTVAPSFLALRGDDGWSVQIQILVLIAD